MAAARWNHRGDAIVYTSEHPALAMLEILVNLDPGELPETYQLIEIEIPDGMQHGFSPPEGWRENQSITRDAWRNFCRDGMGPVLQVPNIIMPRCHNLLINPAHPDAKAIRIVSAEKHPFDQRFLAG